GRSADPVPRQTARPRVARSVRDLRHPLGQYLPRQSGDLCCRPAQLLIEAPALEATDLREEQRVIAVPRLQVDRAMEQDRGLGPADMGLRRLDEGVERLLQRTEPGAVIDEVTPRVVDQRLELQLFLVQAELLQVVVQAEQHRRG